MAARAKVGVVAGDGLRAYNRLDGESPLADGTLRSLARLDGFRTDCVTKTSQPISTSTADRALLVGLGWKRKPRFPGMPAGEQGRESLLELVELARSAGAEIVGTVFQVRESADPATLVGRGKLDEIRAEATAHKAPLIIFDSNLSPMQQRNIEEATERRVIDRTQLILDIFAKHARSREGQLQVELAQLNYMLPRLTGKGASMSRLGGKSGGGGSGGAGGGAGRIGVRGPGEKKLETDRRRIRDRVGKIQNSIEDIRKQRALRREARNAVPLGTIALVGYTNAGKSTLFNALSRAEVLVSSRMFATLDPKLRAIELPSRRRVLLSDTVGFIRNLPHTLVTSFRATLEEVAQAEVLLHVRDAASSYGEEQKAQVEKVLDELESLSKPRIEVLNKIDLLDAAERRAIRDRAAARGEAAVSARTGEGLDALLAAIDVALHSDPIVEAELRVPQHEGAILAAIEAGMVVHKREYEGNVVRLSVSGPASLIGRMRRFRVRGE